MQLKFEGNTHSIDANTLISVLGHYQSIAKVANEIYGGGSRDIRVNVNAIARGSFVVDLDVVQNVVERIFSKDAIEYVAALTTVIGGVYSIYKLFKGRPVKKAEDKRTVEDKVDVNIDIDVVLNVYNQPLVREAVSKSVEKADEDVAVEGFTVTDKNLATTFNREEFKDYIYDDFDSEEDIPEERKVEKVAVLTIVGLKFERNSRWQFLYEGFKIAITVKDDALMRKIDEGERFGKGDAIKVRLLIVQSYNKEYKAYENKSYKIVEFIDHIISTRPPVLFEGHE